MSYQVLYRKYRPRDFDDVVGQEPVVCALTNAVTQGRIAHAYLFSGPRGVGKTTIARILARKANGDSDDADVDVIEIDAASNRGIEEIRELREGVRYAPARGKYKTYIIDEVHMLTKEAFNALLKTLEEPPEHAIFILATTEIEKVPATIISRTQHYEFRRPAITEIAKRLISIAKSEKVKLTEQAARVIAVAADGSLRDAESILGQILAVEDKEVTEKEVEDTLGLPRRETVLKLYQAFLEKNAAAALEIIKRSAEQGHDVERLLRQVLGLARAALIMKIRSSLAADEFEALLPEEREGLRTAVNTAEISHLKQIVRSLLAADEAAEHSPVVELPLELAALEIAGE